MCIKIQNLIEEASKKRKKMYTKDKRLYTINWNKIIIKLNSLNQSEAGAFTKFARAINYKMLVQVYCNKNFAKLAC